MDIEFLQSLFSGGKAGKSFETITNLLYQFGNPQHKLPPVIHITGTNGKGSTGAFLYAILTAAGFRVHRLLSPHLWDWTERITLCNQPIAPEHLMETLKIMARASRGKISFFEAITAGALWEFSKIEADIALIEVGIGGLWDGTNVVSTTCTTRPPMAYDA